MIIKPFVPRVETDPRRIAGANAERQMAHYLDRHFADHPNMQVLHDVRLAFEGDAAQIDHLVVHPFGVAIVESKSVTTAVRINAEDEWERRWKGRWQGMPNPLLQGERQGILLRRLLASRTEALLDKVVLGLFQGTFRNAAFDVFAAISDQGSIQRAARGEARRVLKADAVPNGISKLVDRYRREGSVLNPNPKTFGEAPRAFTEAETLRIAHFLRTRSVEPPGPEGAPIEPPPAGRRGRSARTADARSAVPAPGHGKPAQAAGPADAPNRLACSGCGSLGVEPKIGRYGPYGHCLDCGKNTSVRPPCRACGAKIRVEREAGGFSGRCDACGAVTSIVVGNPPPA